MRPKPFFIGLTGGSASGKTMFLHRIMERFGPEEVCLISQDNYYLPIEQQPLDEQGVRNFDTPQSLDQKRMGEDLQKIKSGQTVELVEYTFNNPERTPKKIVMRPAPVVVVEGIFVFYYPETASLLDFKIFVDAEEHIKLVRRIKRDAEERGYTLEDVLYRYEKHVSPTFRRYIEPMRSEADVVVMNNRDPETAIEMTAAFIRQKISEYEKL